jgi:hypothetical protein
LIAAIVSPRAIIALMRLASAPGSVASAGLASGALPASIRSTASLASARPTPVASR